MPDCRARFAAVAVPAVASLLIAMLCAAPAAADTASFTSPGCSPWTVPTGVTGLSIDAVGGAGGGATGASGDQVSGTLSVSHGQVLDVCVNLGGGTAGSGAGAGAGGGASGVGLGTDFGMPVIVAAGGGGAGGGGVAAGAGGSPGKSGGSGGGSAGTGASISAPGVPNGTRFGPGGPGAGGDGSGKGGGGGGGYYGGGGGGGSGLSGGGGGGGSDFCDTSRVRGCSTHAPTTSPEVVFSYTVASPPTASISSPANGAVYAPGQPVDSSFTCTEGASGPRVSSCADQSGRGSGAAIDTSTPGTHRFTVTAVSGDGLSSSSSVSYLVAAPPRIFLALPANGATFTIGQAVHSFFQCGDGAGGPGLKSCLDQNGQPSGAAIDTSTPGRHTFTVTATSQDGLVASVGAVYQVVPPPTVLSVQAHRGGIVTLLVKVYGPGAIDVMNTAGFRSFALAAHAAAGIQPPRGSFVFGSAHVVSSTTRTLAVRVGLTQAGKLLLRDHRRATINVLVLYTGSGGVPQPVKSVALRVSR